MQFLALVNKATEITIEGHLFKKVDGYWQVWVNSTELLYQYKISENDNRSHYKVSKRQQIPSNKTCEPAKFLRLTWAYSFAVEISKEK